MIFHILLFFIVCSLNFRFLSLSILITLEMFILFFQLSILLIWGLNFGFIYLSILLLSFAVLSASLGICSLVIMMKQVALKEILISNQLWE